jgi:integrase
MALRWEDIDFPNRTFRVQQTVSNGEIVPLGKTDHSLRTVQLAQVALDALTELGTARRFVGGLIFTAPEGGLLNPTNFRERAWRKALTAAGVEYRAMDNMRHTYATLALAGGRPGEWIAAQMGNSYRIMLRHYGRWMRPTDVRHVAELDAAWAADLPGHESDTGAAER